MMNTLEIDKLRFATKDVSVIRTSVHKGNIAPQGYIFFVATKKRGNKKYSMSKMINTSILTAEYEDEFKLILAADLKKHFDI